MKRELTVDELLSENEKLASRLEEVEQLIEAIKAGEVDAFAMNRNNKPEIFTLESGDYAYRMLVENFNEGALTLADDGLIVYTNRYFHELLGLPYEAVIGKSVAHFIHPDSQSNFAELFQKGLSSQSKGEINLSSGEKSIPVYVSFSSLYPTLATVGMIVTDLTEKKKQQELILESEERYHSMVSEVQDYAIISLSTEGVVQNWNKGAEKIKGYKAEEIIGKNFALFYTPEDQKEGLHEKFLEQARMSGKATEENFCVRKNGTRFWGSIVLTALKDNHDNVIGYVKITRDLTERKIFEEEIKTKAKLLEIKNTELQKMNKELESFAYISSHDLQEPLRKIQTFVSRLTEVENENLSSAGKEMFQRMLLAANRMQILIEDLLSYSRNSTADKKFESVDLNKLVQEVKDDLHEEILEKHAIVETGELCQADIIPFQFRQMLHNLIGNSLKFSTPGKPPHIKISSELLPSFPGVKGKMICHITLSDNGIGFEQQYSEKIFQVFQRLHTRTDYQGTGIGLAIVKKIIDNHNGLITAKSVPSEGAQFDIYIPTS